MRTAYPTSFRECFLAHMAGGQRDSYLTENISDAAAPDEIHRLSDSPRVELNCRVSAIDGKRCAGNETRIIARQKCDRRGYVAGLPHTSDGMLR